MADTVTDFLAKDVTKFMGQEVLELLKTQFENLCDEMIKAIETETIDINGAVQTISKIAINTPVETITKVLNDVASIPRSQRVKHELYKKMFTSRDTIKKKLEKNDIETTLKTFRTKDFKK